ncbi:hypothetical protein PPTG_00564 [Phytophthora nicotianae INRA-310]|uniref:Myb/SANT-like domain-containing protein n=1 Tax=Phytophthora nicotianae (strain INRA-310) TaxID=761204 RepID=W2RHS8_PHYN3|nr:hypothetical protein PPTG_00564 [Phytophthora nicotianae INRA-310]ETN24125.1 hypothetical protein PPTG_00564 [Phytophthora nicotianae INRA-310]
MASSKPRGRPPADGNFIMWTEPLVESLLKLRFEKYAEPMAAARGTKSLRVAWAELAKELTLQNNGDVVSVEQCRNKLKALRNKWLAYHSGMVSEPVCLALMDACWGSEKDDGVPAKSQSHSRPSPEHRKQAKKPRVGPSSPSGAEGGSLVPIASAPAPASLVDAASDVALVSTSAPPFVEAKGPTSTAALRSRPQTGAPTSKAAPVLDGGKQAIPQDITSASTQTARLNKPPLECTGMAKVEKLINDGFAKVLEGQAKQLKLVEEQNQLLAQIFETLQRSKHQDNTSDLE